VKGVDVIEGLFSHALDVSGIDKSVYSNRNVESNPSSLKGVKKLAQKVRIEYVDDLTGEADDTVSNVEFALEGKSYSIDLSEKNATELRDSLAKFIAAARRAPGTSTRGAGKRAGSAASSSREETSLIREWANSQTNLSVNSRGRISSDVVDAYYAAHPKAS
jgi:hypothetical protein